MVLDMLRGLLKSCLQSSWMVWEKCFAFFSHFQNLHTLRYGIVTINIKKYQGEPLVCLDETLISKGDLIGELHLDNQAILMLLRTEGPDRAALKIARLARKSMQQINQAFHDRPELKNVKALIGITLLHRGLTHGLGFEERPIASSLFRKLATIYLRLLLSVIHPEGRMRIGKKKERLVPMLLIHSRLSLQSRFG